MMEQLNNDLKVALKAGQGLKVTVVRGIIATCKDRQIAKMGELSDEDILGVISKLAKQHNESIQAYQKAGREDLVAQEQEELLIIQGYLPAQLSPEELAGLVDEAISQTKATSIAQIGAVMGYISPKIKGRADGGLVSQLVKQKLS